MALLPWAAAAEGCRITGHDKPPKASLDASMAQPIYSRDLDKRQMTARHGLLKTNQTELGLTTSEVRLEVMPKVWFQPQGGGRGCAVLDSVTVVFRISAVRVEIARDFPTDSCAYRVIREHEDQHVRFVRQALEFALPDMRRRLAAAVEEQRALVTRASSSAAAAKAVQDAISARIRPAFEAYEREARRLNASIDTPQSYAALHRRCARW